MIQQTKKPNNQRIEIYKRINYMYNQGALTISGYNKILKELNLNEEDLNFLNRGVFA